MSRLTLASASPRRSEMLQRLGYVFSIRPASLSEAVGPGEDALGYVRRIAEEKAAAVEADGVVLAADTSVVLGGEILGKPADGEEAAAMLRRLSGLVHEVMSAVCVRQGDQRESFVVRTAVRFRRLREEEIARYVGTGEPLDKAGAYGIQGGGAAFVEAIFGSYSNVVGLPLAETIEALARAGIHPEGGE